MAEEYGSAKTSVWWDLEKCPVPAAVDPHAIAQNIKSALYSAGYRGPIVINAFGDTHNLTPDASRALSITGIALHHIPSGFKDGSDKRILVDMLFWAVDNSTPANYLLISGDRDFASALHQLSMRRYNILLAYPTIDVPSSLFGAAKIIWHWSSLAMGEKLRPTIKDTKQLDTTSGSNFLRNAECKGSFNLTSNPSKAISHDSFIQTVNSFSGVHIKCGHESFSESDEARGQSSTHDSDIAWSPMGSPDRNIHGSKIFCPKTNILTSTSSTRPKISSTHETRVSSHSISDGAKSVQTLQNDAHNRLDSCKDIQDNISSDKSNPDSSAEVCVAPPKVKFTLRSKVIPRKSRHHAKLKPSQCTQSTLPKVPDMIPNYPPNMRPNLQVDPIFQMQNQVPCRSMLPAELRTDMVDSAKDNISSDLQQSSNIQPPTYTYPQILLPSEKNLSYPSNLKPNYVTQIKSSIETVHASSSKLSLPEYLGTDILHRVHIKILSKAMEMLKKNMIEPSEKNLGDCIKYGDMCILNFNLHDILDRAVELKDIISLSTRGGSKVYLPHDSALWHFVDPLSMRDGYPKDLWDELYKYLSSHQGCEAMMQSQNRYDAAQKLKKSCLKTLLLGHIIHMLNLAIKIRQWLRPHQSGWSPLSITLKQRTEPSSFHANKEGSPISAQR